MLNRLALRRAESQMSGSSRLLGGLHNSPGSWLEVWPFPCGQHAARAACSSASWKPEFGESRTSAQITIWYRVVIVYALSLSLSDKSTHPILDHPDWEKRRSCSIQGKPGTLVSIAEDFAAPLRCRIRMNTDIPGAGAFYAAKRFTWLGPAPCPDRSRPVQGGGPPRTFCLTWGVPRSRFTNREIWVFSTTWRPYCLYRVLWEETRGLFGFRGTSRRPFTDAKTPGNYKTVA